MHDNDQYLTFQIRLAQALEDLAFGPDPIQRRLLNAYLHAGIDEQNHIDAFPAPVQALIKELTALFRPILQTQDREVAGEAVTTLSRDECLTLALRMIDLAHSLAADFKPHPDSARTGHG